MKLICYTITCYMCRTFRRASIPYVLAYVQTVRLFRTARTNVRVPYVSPDARITYVSKRVRS